MQEVVLMVEKCGFSPAEAIRAATVTGADLLGRADDLGQIAQGYLADVIAVPEDPTQNIATLHDVCFVMKEGRVFRNDRA
ncbi:MAG: amidohydrolase family protein, partial [Proteobacteria bacterium]|nr:amidohydrolase family protein [Pseudomonadota bacterium]